jgi:hypothetical protein
MANDIPNVFAMVQEAPVPHIVFVHRPTRYAPSWLGAQPWDDTIFGFQGDLLHPGNQINTTIEWPITPFARTVHTTVPHWTTWMPHGRLPLATTFWGPST